MTPEPEALASLRTVQPQPPERLEVPESCHELAAPTPAEARAMDVLFSKEAKPANELLGLWAAGMFAKDLVEDTMAKLEEEEGVDKEKKPGSDCSSL